MSRILFVHSINFSLESYFLMILDTSCLVIFSCRAIHRSASCSVLLFVLSSQSLHVKRSVSILRAGWYTELTLCISRPVIILNTQKITEKWTCREIRHRKNRAVIILLLRNFCSLRSCCIYASNIFWNLLFQSIGRRSRTFQYIQYRSLLALATHLRQLHDSSVIDEVVLLDSFFLIREIKIIEGSEPDLEEHFFPKMDEV